MQKHEVSVAVDGSVSPTPAAQAFDNRVNVEPTVVRIIAAKVKRLVGQRKFRRDDYEDLIQELTLEWLRYRPSFDPAKAKLSTYATRVVESRIAAIIRLRAATKRSQGVTVLSLDQAVCDVVDGQVRLGDIITDGDLRNRLDY